MPVELWSTLQPLFNAKFRKAQPLAQPVSTDITYPQTLLNVQNAAANALLAIVVQIANKNSFALPV